MGVGGRGRVAAGCNESELITTLLPCWRERPNLFPVAPARSWSKRRLRGQQMELARDRQCAIDCPPVPVLAFRLVPGAAGANLGKVPITQQTVFGDKLHLPMTLGGILRDFALAPASANDVAILVDKAFFSAPLAAALLSERDIALITVLRRPPAASTPRASSSGRSTTV